MKIALVHHLKRGGAHLRIVEQIRSLSSGIQLQEFLLEGAEPTTVNPIIGPCSQRGDSAPAWKKPFVRYGDLWRKERAWSALCDLVETQEFDAVWANPCMDLKVPPLSEALARRTVLYLDEPDRKYFDSSVRGSTRVWTRPVYFFLNLRKRTLQQRNAKAINVVVTNSAFTAEMISAAYGRAALVLPLGVHERFSPGDGHRIRNVALSVGTLIPSKGHDLAISAIALSRSAMPLLIIAPRREEGELQRLQAIAANLNVDVEFRFAVSDDDLVDAYRCAAVTLYLASAEPFGLVSLEAQACGSTLVIVNEGGLPETARGSRLVEVAERNVESIAAAIRRAVEPVTSEDRMRNAQVVRASWSWAHSSSLLQRALEEVVSA
jgi:glycosyltransferase involved in cell wall biosynthesis